jgi:cytochrome c oxidase cbb3-type subunit 3
MLLWAVNAGAQTTTPTDLPNPDTQSVEIPKALFDPDFWILFFLISILVFVIISLAYSMRKLSGIMYPSRAEEKGAAAPARVTAWQKLMKALTRSVPVTQEEDVMLDHNYDGIRELDNKLPPWWVYGFYVTILFAVVYIFNYHIAKTSKLQLAEYNAEMTQAEADKTARAKIAGENITDENVVMMKDAVSLGEGKEVFSKNCVTCHGGQAQGLVGPNLTDEYWIHGGGIKNIFHTINTGVTGKAMISWKGKLSPKQMEEVASYIITLQGSNPPGALPPAGDKYVEGALKDSTTSAKADSVAAGKM